MKRKTRLLSWILVLVMTLGLLPVSAMAALAPPYESGDKELIFNCSVMSGAGAAQMDGWASGEYPGVQERLAESGDQHDTMNSEWLKTRLMIRAMNFESWDYEDPIGYYVPESTTGSTHELTLYGHVDVDPADITVEGVRLSGQIERHRLAVGCLALATQVALDILVLDGRLMAVKHRNLLRHDIYRHHFVLL